MRVRPWVHRFRDFLRFRHRSGDNLGSISRCFRVLTCCWFLAPRNISSNIVKSPQQTSSWRWPLDRLSFRAMIVTMLLCLERELTLMAPTVIPSPASAPTATAFMGYVFGHTINTYLDTIPNPTESFDGWYWVPNPEDIVKESLPLLLATNISSR